MFQISEEKGWLVGQTGCREIKARTQKNENWEVESRVVVKTESIQTEEYKVRVV